VTSICHAEAKLTLSSQWGPLAQGSLARPIDQAGKTTRSEGKAGPSETDSAIISRVQELADKKGWPMSHVALAWINQRISSPIIGFSSVKRMDEAVEGNEKELSEEEEKYLEELYQPKAVMGFDTSLKRVRIFRRSLSVGFLLTCVAENGVETWRSR
jgi:aryl-alcohol dehydrogenase-like predicted oxidoreductase